MVNFDQVKQLREETNVSISECQKALKEAGDDLKKAKEYLRKWGKDLADKVSSKETKEGVIESYIHPNKKVGVLLDIRCETDFVTRSEDFQALVRNLVLHIAGVDPHYISAEDIPGEVLNSEKDIYYEQFAKTGKPKELIDKMVEGKLNKYKKEVSLLSQPFVKNPDKTVQDIINEGVSCLGENIIIKRFIRYQI